MSSSQTPVLSGDNPRVIHVPGPRPYPLIGNIPQLGSPQEFIQSIEALFEQYGPFVRIHMPSYSMFFCKDADVVRDLRIREAEFPKLVFGNRNPLYNLRMQTIGLGLFTANDTDSLWEQAHRILLPAFGSRSLRQAFPAILAVVKDLITYLSTEKKGVNVGQTPSHPADFLVTDIMTRTTFESICAVAFSYRINCIGATEMPPFVLAMVDALNDAQRAMTAIVPDALLPEIRRKRQRADELMKNVVDGLIKERRATMSRNESVPGDLLQIMLTTTDPATGQRLPDENIRHQLITFLIAGHETTSGALSYVLYYLCKTPHAEKLLIEEIDRELGQRVPTYQDIERLEYAGRCLKEALRLEPTAPSFSKSIIKDSVLANKYFVEKGTKVSVMLRNMHRDPLYWGASADSFEPDRFLPEAVSRRHSDCYHPFGLGMRSCIGFQFAMLEAKLVLALIYQKFRPCFSDPRYVLKHMLTLTTKPDGFRMQFLPRLSSTVANSASVSHNEAIIVQSSGSKSPVASPTALLTTPASLSPSLIVLFGSNMGASEELALNMKRQAELKGLLCSVHELDSALKSGVWSSKLINTNAVVLIITSTYNGHPPDNATRFAGWLSSLEAQGMDVGGSLSGLRFAVLGCGNSQWKATYQKFPRFIHQSLQQRGAIPLLPQPGECDSDGNFESDATAWSTKFWLALDVALSTSTSSSVSPSLSPPTTTTISPRLYTVEIVNYSGCASDECCCSPTGTCTGLLRDSMQMATVIVNRELQDTTHSLRSTRHIELLLPHESLSYKAGDHLAVLPENPPKVVLAMAHRCGIDISDTIILHEYAPRSDISLSTDGANNRLRIGIPMLVNDLLSKILDLMGPVTRHELQMLALCTRCPPDVVKLTQLATDSSEARFEISDSDTNSNGSPLVTILDVLTRFPSIEFDVGLLASMRPIIKPRYYSISSSPLALDTPKSCSITVGVHEFKLASPSGSLQKGLCSTYLAGCGPSAHIRCIVKDTGSKFHLPTDDSKELILISAGTGIAPMRSFLQERALKTRLSVGPVRFYFGCRDPDHDFLYATELQKWKEEGVLTDLQVAFSRQPNKPKRYVQNLLEEQGEIIWTSISQGAVIYICGDAKHFAPSVVATIEHVIAQYGKMSVEEAKMMRAELEKQNRLLQDIWSN